MKIIWRRVFTRKILTKANTAKRMRTRARTKQGVRCPFPEGWGNITVRAMPPRRKEFWHAKEEVMDIGG